LIGHIARFQSIADGDAGYVEPSDMLAELRGDKRDLAGRLRGARNVWDEHRDIATASLMKSGLTRPGAALGPTSRRAAGRFNRAMAVSN
jgi:DNA-binding ferritin-like protein